MRTADLWRAAFGWEVDAERVALAMILFKLSRSIHGPTRDNLVDIAGYARVIEMVWERIYTEGGTPDAGCADSACT